MKKIKTLIVIFVLVNLTLTLVKCTTAQTANETEQFFSRDYAGISIRFNATRETVPGGNIRINLCVSCTAKNVTVHHLNLSVYGFRYGQEKIFLLNSTSALKDTSLVYNDTYSYNYSVPVPTDVWDATHAKLDLKYTIVDSSFEYNPSFPITVVKNVYLEELKSKLESLNATYWQLNQTFWESFGMNLTEENLAQLNETYWQFKGSQSELDTTRRVVAILAITTVLFVATTLYLVMRKPKERWW